MANRSDIQMLILGFELIGSASTEDQHQRARKQVEKLASRMSAKEVEMALALFKEETDA